MIDERTLSADVYAAIAKAYDRECDIEDAVDEILALIEADRQSRGEPVAWGAFYFGGKRNGKLYSHTETEAQIDAYIADVHRSNDSITLRKGPLYIAPQPAEPVKSTCKKCNGTGVESTRFHGVWPNGEECLEPIKCDQCDGFGTTSVAEPVKVPSNTEIDELSREWGLQSAAYPSKSMVRDFAHALLARYTTTKEQP